MAATLSSLKLPLLPTLNHKCLPEFSSVSSNDHDLSLQLPQHPTPSIPLVSLPLTAITLSFLVESKDAFTTGGEFGILEGKRFALIHPLVMSGLFVYTLCAGYLGWQWLRVRPIQEEINVLNKQVKPSLVTADGSLPASPAEIMIQQLTEARLVLGVMSNT